MKIKHIGFFLKDSILDAERVMDDLVGYCEMEHTKQGTIYHLQVVVDGEIVRCKDCKHSIPDMSGDELQGYECDLHYDSYWDADDFCSNGEKKDDNTKQR